MFSWVKNIFDKIKDLSGTVDNYKQDSIIQSLPTVAYVNKAKKLIDERHYEKAQEVLTKALDISTQDSRVYKYLGKISEIGNKFSDAANYYEKSARLNPQDKEIWLRLGMCRLNSKNLEDALTAFERANKVTPFNTDVFTGWGMTLMKQKKYALARDKFLEATNISKYNFTAILLSAIMEIRLCDYESAEVKLKFLAKVAPNEGSTYEYANLKLLKSDYKEAEKFAKKSIEINKHMLPAYFVLGEVYSQQRDFENTQNTFRLALERGLDSDTLHFEWGKAYTRFFDFDSAKKEFQTAINMNNDYENAKIGLALINSYSGDFELLDELKEKNGSNVYIQEAIGLEWIEKGLYEDAVEMFKRALRTDAKQIYNYFNLAKTYQKLENKDKTREFFEKFISEADWYIEGFLEYSRWLISIGDFADAQRKLRRAQKLEDKNIDVLNLLFFTSYTLVKHNICDYNIKEALTLANKVQTLGNFDYEAEKAELETILKDIQGTK